MPTLLRRVFSCSPIIGGWGAIFACLAVLLSPAPARAQGYTFSTLYNFTATNAKHQNADGATPDTAPISDGQGHLYGTTTGGGGSNYGTLFEYNLSARTFTLLHSFGGIDGWLPQSRVILDGQGHLYGATESGGRHDAGTLYEYDLSTGVFRTLVSFSAPGFYDPFGSLAFDGQGHLYGSTISGGGSGVGTLFEYDLTTNTLTRLHSFSRASGLYPYSGVALDGQGHLYGTTGDGGASGYGTIFQYTLATRTFQTLLSFNTVTGIYPQGGLVSDGAGFVYGTTSQSGRYSPGVFGSGTLFKINTATGNVTTQIVFGQGNGKGSAYPNGDLSVDEQGHLYGTTKSGGPYSDGTVYKFNLVNHSVATLHTFSGTDGAHPQGGVSVDSAGTLYGSTYEGGANFTGTVFALTPNGGG